MGGGGGEGGVGGEGGKVVWGGRGCCISIADATD